MSDSLPIRVAWRDFRDVEILAGESAVKHNPFYAAAKAGDVRAAFELIAGTFTKELDSALLKSLGSASDLRWLPVVAEEAVGVNRIPLALAEALEDRVGGESVLGIVQTNRAWHTGSDGWHRLSSPALFEGSVEIGARYVLVDDFIGQGGTLANLRGYVEAKGGIVEGAIVLTGQSRSAALRVSRETLVALQSKHGTALENLWRSWFGYSIDFLTESEARYLLRVENVDTIRNRLLAARRGTDAG